MQQGRLPARGQGRAIVTDRAGTGRPGFLAGAAWSTLGSAASVALALGMFLLFARALGPEILGRVAMAVAISELLRACGLPGLYQALLQRRDATGQDGAAALAAWVVLGLALLPVHAAVVALLLGTGGADGWVLLALGLRIPMDLAALQPAAELARREAYGVLARRGLLASLGASLLGLLLLGMGQPLTALLAYTLALSAGTLLAAAIGQGALLRPRWDAARLRAMRSEALSASASQGVVLAGHQLDQVLFGSIAGSAAFALFNLGRRVEMALTVIAWTLSTALFQPAFAAQQGPAGRAPVLRRALALVTASTGLAAAVFITTADRLVPALLGEAWVAAAPAAAILAAVGHLRSLGAVPVSLLAATGRNAALLRRNAAVAATGLALVALTAPLGVTACAAAMLLRAILSVGLMAQATRQDAAPLGWAVLLARPAAGFLAMSAAAVAARLLLGEAADVPGVLAAAGIAAVLAGLPFVVRELRPR